ncbi:MAG: hypothetical protein WD757_07140 [Actinomycetota bacterium]
MGEEVHVWEIRTPGGATGLEFAKARMVSSDRVLAHSLPREIEVTVSRTNGEVLARSTGLVDETPTPMARLQLAGGEVRRANIWPEQSDIGTPVILPGGEVGLLRTWSNAPDGSEWTWTVEFRNTDNYGGRGVGLRVIPPESGT